MRRFLKEPGGADAYPGLEVRFVAGANPDLLVFDEPPPQAPPRRVDLTAFSSQLELHQLMLREGFALRDEGDAPEALCDDWASRGECDANAGFMRTRCARSCTAKDDL